REPAQPDDRDLRGVRAVERAAEERVHKDTGVGLAEAELEDAVVGDGEREDEREAAGPPVRRIDPRRLAPRQLAVDPGGREDLEASERDRRRGEGCLEVDRVLEEEAEVAFGAWIMVGEQAGGQREEGKSEERERDPAVRAPLDRR